MKETITHAPWKGYGGGGGGGGNALFARQPEIVYSYIPVLKYKLQLDTLAYTYASRSSKVVTKRCI